MASNSLPILPKRGSNALQQISSKENLTAAWLYISDSATGYKRDTQDIDGQTINRFAQKSDEHIHAISHRLRVDDNFDFDRLKLVLEKKKSGDDRVICIPTVRDRIVQRSLLDFLLSTKGQSFETPVSFGFVRGKGVSAAVAEALKLRSKHRFVYKTDISAFFDRIDREDLRLIINKKIRFPSLRKILVAAASSELKVSGKSRKEKVRNAGIIKGRGVRQGMPLSPYFANLFLYDFDHCCINSKLSMVRYADDLIYFAATYDECRDIDSLVRKELDEIGFSLPELGTSKTRIYKPKESAEFLGIEIEPFNENYRAVIPKSKFEEVRCELLSFGNLKNLQDQNITIRDFFRIVDGKLSGWLGSYEFCANLKAFENSIKDTRSQLIKNLFVKELNIDLTRSDVKWFLELNF